MHLHIDPSIAGISGNMFLGACLEVGLDPNQLETHLKKLKLPEAWCLHRQKDERGSIAGSYVEFRVSESGPAVDDTTHHHHHGHGHVHGRHFSSIRDLINQSDLPEPVKERAIAIFRRLGEAEARVHGTTLEKVHFHEVGALDSILDIVGSALAIELLGVRSVTAAIPVDGQGTVECAHGTFPVPVPAVLNIFKNQPLRQIAVESELVTPTGAAILAELADGRFEPAPEGTLKAIGYGLGSRTLTGRPNVLRLTLSNPKLDAADPALKVESVTLLETNLDDLSGEEIGHAMDRLMEEGALDVALVPLIMKKGRPGSQLQVMCQPDKAEHLTRILFSTTGTLGVRFRTQSRRTLERHTETVETPYGPIRIKTSRLDGKMVTQKPEADDVRQASHRHGVPVKTILTSIHGLLAQLETD